MLGNLNSTADCNAEMQILIGNLVWVPKQTYVYYKKVIMVNEVITINTSGTGYYEV